jgi:AraC family transcriptional regulator
MPLQIVQALKFIDKNLHLPLNIKKLAQHVGWTHEHFSRLFVQHMGRSPRDAIIERRIERACQLLLHKEWSIKQIAYSVGYLDENYFCRVFKTINGMTASEYRLKNFDPRFDVLDAADLGIIYPPNSILYKVGSYSDGN